MLLVYLVTECRWTILKNKHEMNTMDMHSIDEYPKLHFMFPPFNECNDGLRAGLPDSFLDRVHFSFLHSIQTSYVDIQPPT
jgi:hypothetical protein